MQYNARDAYLRVIGDMLSYIRLKFGRIQPLSLTRTIHLAGIYGALASIAARAAALFARTVATSGS